MRRLVAGAIRQILGLVSVPGLKSSDCRRLGFPRDGDFFSVCPGPRLGDQASCPLLSGWLLHLTVTGASASGWMARPMWQNPSISLLSMMTDAHEIAPLLLIAYRSDF
jgi:hypothetical protein